MVCEANETDVIVDIPAVMLPQDAGATLEASIKNNSIGKPSSQWFREEFNPLSPKEKKEREILIS